MRSIFKVIKQLSILVISITLSFQSLAESTVVSEVSQAERIVVDFYEKIFVQHNGDVRKVATQYVHEDYIQQHLEEQQKFYKRFYNWEKKGAEWSGFLKGALIERNSK